MGKETKSLKKLNGRANQVPQTIQLLYFEMFNLFSKSLSFASGHEHQSNSRSTADYDAAHSVSEAVREKAGDVIVHNLHLATLELPDLEQADLVLLWVLGNHTERDTRSTGIPSIGGFRSSVDGALPCERA